MSHYKKPNNYLTQKMKRVREVASETREEEFSHELRPVFRKPRKRPHWK